MDLVFFIVSFLLKFFSLQFEILENILDRKLWCYSFWYRAGEFHVGFKILLFFLLSILEWFGYVRHRLFIKIIKFLIIRFLGRFHLILERLLSRCRWWGQLYTQSRRALLSLWLSLLRDWWFLWSFWLFLRNILRFGLWHRLRSCHFWSSLRSWWLNCFVSKRSIITKVSFCRRIMSFTSSCLCDNIHIMCYSLTVCSFLWWSYFVRHWEVSIFIDWWVINHTLSSGLDKLTLIINGALVGIFHLVFIPFFDKLAVSILPISVLLL